MMGKLQTGMLPRPSCHVELWSCNRATEYQNYPPARSTRVTTSQYHWPQADPEFFLRKHMR